MDWRVTATTLFCDVLKRWVPIMVFRDGKTHCGYFYRHQMVSRKGGQGFPCHGPEQCSLCAAYQQDVFQREGPSGSKAGSKE